ncbi:hypothetical protein [Curtobacterium sp. NPDC089689]|uniref:hypothetical protein n=1 Tax=Curtobacterium sp. NPDC089689 TaxID=3363968 RepID=UPI0037F4A330
MDDVGTGSSDEPVPTSSRRRWRSASDAAFTQGIAALVASRRLERVHADGLFEAATDMMLASDLCTRAVTVS